MCPPAPGNSWIYCASPPSAQQLLTCHWSGFHIHLCLRRLPRLPVPTPQHRPGPSPCLCEGCLQGPPGIKTTDFRPSFTCLRLQPLALEDQKIASTREDQPSVLVLEDCNSLSVTYLTRAEAPAEEACIRGSAGFPAALSTVPCPPGLTPHHPQAHQPVLPNTRYCFGTNSQDQLPKFPFISSCFR